MKAENKIPLDEVHRRLNRHLGEEYPPNLFQTLMASWRITKRKPTAGKKGWLSKANVRSLLDYARPFHPMKVYI